MAMKVLHLLLQLLSCCLGGSSVSSPFAPPLPGVRVNNYAAKTPEAPVAFQKEPCSLKPVWIERPDNESDILYQRRTRSFFLFARLEVECNVGTQIKTRWVVYPVPDTTTDPDWEKPLDTSSLSGVETIKLTVPSFILEHGLYLFRFNVKVTPIGSRTALRGSDQVYVKIEKSDLVAHIAGGMWRTVSFFESWILNGSQSHDPDTQDGTGLRLTWFCTKNRSDYGIWQLIFENRCHPDQDSLRWLTFVGTVVTVPAQTLPPNTIYYFRLVAVKDTRKNFDEQIIEVQSVSPHVLSVVCIENCRRSLIPTQRFILSGKCVTCGTHREPLYYWSLLGKNFAEVNFDWSSRTSTGRFGAYLSIHALTFTQFPYETYALMLKVTTSDGRSSAYRHEFRVNSPPRAGKCGIKPRWGTAFLTKFVVWCSGFSDDNLPLTYKVIVASNVPKTAQVTSVAENTFGIIMYFGYEPKTPPSFLPVGVPSQKYTLTLYVQVHNSLGVFTQVSLRVRVQNPVRSRPLTVVFRELLASVSGLTAPMSSYMQSGDYLHASYLTYMAASILNYIETKSTLPVPKAQFRKNLIKTAMNISVESTLEINQIVAALSLVTEDAEEVDIKSQDLVLQKLAEVTRVLKRKRSENNWSEEADIQSSGILKCLSNILRAALPRRRKVNVGGVEQAFSIMENLTEVVYQGKVPGETETLMKTKDWNITLNKDEVWQIPDAIPTRDTCRNCFYPSLKKGNVSAFPKDTVISTTLYEFDENPFPWLGYTTEIATMILGFKMAETKANGDLVGIVPEGADIIVARKDRESSTFEITMGPDRKQAYTTGGFHLEVKRNSTVIYIQILTKLEVTFNVLVFTGTNITHAHPIASFKAFHNSSTVASKNETTSNDCVIKTPYIICLPESLLAATAQESGADTYNISIVLMTAYIVRYETKKLVSICVFSDQCLFLNSLRSVWTEDTCRLGPLTDCQRVHCVCDTKSQSRLPDVSASLLFSIMFLAAKVLVTPNAVDLERALITDIPKNPVALLTVLFIFVIYFLLFFWALRKDRIDRERRDRVIVLPDNDPFDKVRFLVTLYTGSRWGAGTKADVFLQLIGQNGTSDVHCLQHSYFPSFQKGSADRFLLTTKTDLGDICSLRVWHNNKGPSPSWFLSRVKVENMSTRETWFFMCRKWLSLDKGDHLLERTFSATDPKTPLPRTDVFLINLARSLADNHLWFSVFSASVLTGTFNRLQRLSSCLAVLLLNLFVNIMFFNAEKDEESTVHFRYLRSIVVGVECALLTIPVEMIIIVLFKFSKKKPCPPDVAQEDPQLGSPSLAGKRKNWKERLQKSYLSETSSQMNNNIPLENLPSPSDSQSPPSSTKTGSQGDFQNRSNCTVSEKDKNATGTDEQTIITNSPPTAKAGQSQLPSNSSFKNNYTEEGGNLQEEEKSLSITSTSSPNTQHLIFCWWCVYVSWALVIAVTGVSSFFIVLYGLNYGYQTSVEWLIASAVSFIENVFFISILKISFLIAIRTIRPKYCENIIWLTPEKYSELRLGKEIMNADEMREMHLKLAKIRGSKKYKPLGADDIAIMMRRAKIKVKAYIFIKGLISHLVFLTLLFNFVYSTENANSFHYNQFIHRQFSPRLSSVDKLEHIYMWVNDWFLPMIHNDLQPTFLPESWSKIIGLPRMRQVRAKRTKKKCFRPYSFVNNFVIGKSHCLPKYGTDIPERGDFAGIWTEMDNQSVSTGVSSYTGFTYQWNWTPWVYYSYGDLHTYGPSGYTFYFFPEEEIINSTARMDALQQNDWLDEYTWAVIIELTTFNSDADLFCTITVIFEMSNFGIIRPSLSVHSFALPVFHQQTNLQIFLFVILLAFLLIYVVDELYTIGREKKYYLRNIFNIINLGLKTALLLVVCLQIMKFKIGEDILVFYLLHPDDFIHFHAVSQLDQTLRISLGFLAFLAVLKTLKYFILLYDVRLAQRSILAALPSISSMAFIVVAYFFVFMAFGYLAFGQHEWNYNNMIHSAQTIFSYCVSAFRDTEFSSNRLLGGLFLGSFMLVMICVLINLLHAVIMSAYSDTKRPVVEEPSDEELVVACVWQRLRQIFYRLICKKYKTSKHDFFHSVLYGKPKRKHHRHLGLKKRKINGKKMVYLVI
ncbi:polycystin family receptor for egg jelly [Phaethornis superciliosus]